jgi:hypothetical protein
MINQIACRIQVSGGSPSIRPKDTSASAGAANQIAGVLNGHFLGGMLGAYPE